MTRRGGPRRFPAEPLLAAVRRAGAWEMTRYRPWWCCGGRIGWILPDFAAVLAGFDHVFRVEDHAVHLRDLPGGVHGRSTAVTDVVRRLLDQPGFARWNGEFGAVGGPDGRTLLRLPRCATRPFGVRSRGAHLNGFVASSDGPRLWIAVRHPTNSDYGGMLDTLAGGYMAAGTTPRPVVRREAAEEAGISGGMARQIAPAGVVRGCRGHEHGVTPYALDVFDLELPEDFVPANQDGEVASFHLYDPADVVDALTVDRFKFNAVPVVVDWLLRHGLVRPGGAADALPAALTAWDPD